MEWILILYLPGMQWRIRKNGEIRQRISPKRGRKMVIELLVLGLFRTSWRGCLFNLTWLKSFYSRKESSWLIKYEKVAGGCTVFKCVLWQIRRLISSGCLVPLILRPHDLTSLLQPSPYYKRTQILSVEFHLLYSLAILCRNMWTIHYTQYL